ncbi:hypothetical protein IFM89_031518 [Coptis chinensis]|uniref:Vacuolar protein sorting-associated protein 54 C-terminal domain-containing protein n=1 Tax=Coptis chinensis TaxID=261450 RepID=A0A835IGM8_9MAGN|nr:hypothetical protein IFM89_031518 [Coptis chinensis]
MDPLPGRFPRTSSSASNQSDSPLPRTSSSFEDIQNHSKNNEGILDLSIGQGEALVACLREVPSLYFKEDFALQEGATFRAACPFSSPLENVALQEKLSYYLDTVEVHLVKEISLRSNSFFQAQGQLQDLNGEVFEACGRIRELKEMIRILDGDLVDSARSIQDLNSTRSNLIALQHKLRLILYVNQAMSALKLLVAAADCAGALDVTDDLQHLLDSDELAGLHCFRHLRDQLANSIDSVNSILSEEFMHASIHNAKDVDLVILSRLKAAPARVTNGKDDDCREVWSIVTHKIPGFLIIFFATSAYGCPGNKVDMIALNPIHPKPQKAADRIQKKCKPVEKRKASLPTAVKKAKVKLDEDQTSSFRDRLLPLIIGLLRTAKLPTVLRIYRDTLVADMKTVIKTTVAEFLPILVARPLESDLTTGERSVDTDGQISNIISFELFEFGLNTVSLTDNDLFGPRSSFTNFYCDSGGGSSLASKLRNLSSESFVRLLDAIFMVVQREALTMYGKGPIHVVVVRTCGLAVVLRGRGTVKSVPSAAVSLGMCRSHGLAFGMSCGSYIQKHIHLAEAHLVRAAEVKRAIDWIMCNLDDCFAADSVGTSPALGAAVAESGQESSPYSLQRNANKFPPIHAKGNETSSPSNMARNFRADVLRENTEAVFAACDAAHGRWAKLLGVRALLHPRLRLQEFLSIYDITQDFIAATEKIGGRLGYSIRGTLQSQSKAFVDFQHDSRMAKIKAVLDQEMWVPVDVPDEFQAIANSLISTEAVINGNAEDGFGNVTIDDSELDSANGDELTVDAGVSPPQHGGGNGSVVDNTALGGAHLETKLSTSSPQNNISNGKEQKKNSNAKEHKKSEFQSIMYKDVGYRMANCGLILLKMLSDYVDMNHFLPALSSELVHRVVEILKFFNTRTCQLVLGAGAMQVSGLKSIAAKHLALASQVISFVYAVIPDIKRILFIRIPESRKALLLLEIDRVAQDYKVHRDEIHTKLVQIMRERLLLHLRGLPKIVESWNGPEDGDDQKNPSPFAKQLTKEVGFLHRELPKFLHEKEILDIFRQVVEIFHSQISEAFSKLELHTPQANNRLYRDTQHILGCIRSLPSDSFSKDGLANSGKLDEFLLQRFGTEAG